LDKPSKSYDFPQPIAPREALVVQAREMGLAQALEKGLGLALETEQGSASVWDLVVSLRAPGLDLKPESALWKYEQLLLALLRNRTEPSSRKIDTIILFSQLLLKNCSFWVEFPQTPGTLAPMRPRDGVAMPNAQSSAKLTGAVNLFRTPSAMKVPAGLYDCSDLTVELRIFTIRHVS
jgi:hypothetical protein